MAIQQDQKTPDIGSIRAIPTIREYEKRYGISCEGNDQKAIRAFRDFESKEKLNRLRTELIWIKNEYVATKVLDEVVGRKRKARHLEYSKWAGWMLMLLAQAR
jgi:hypothetical protein